MISNDDTISQIPLDQLHESPFNPRKTFTAIDELAASIKSEGRVLSPLLVRPIIPPLFNAGADTQPEAAAGYEIVFGHRRFRAATEAGLASVPCMVRAMTDAEARSAQIAENLSRKDVHPIEEAEGFQAMIDNDGISADELAELVGKSKSYVYGRLKLLQAVPLVREACLRGEIGSEVALLVARVGPAKLQEKALHRIKAVGASMGDGGQASFRRIKSELAENFTLELKGAIFDREDATLLPDAGVCSACPKRSGNSPVFEDIAAEGHARWAGPGSHCNHGEPNRCTDPDCWEAKTKAHLARKAAALEAEGKVVVSGGKARQAISAQGEVKGAYVALDPKVRAALKKANVKPQVQHIVNQRDGKVTQAVLQADLVAAGVMKAQAAGSKPKRESYEEQNRRYEQERKAREARAKAETQARMALLQAVREQAAGRERTEFELRLVTVAALAGLQWNDRENLARLHGAKSYEQLVKRVDTLSAAELTTLLLDAAIIENVESSGHGGRQDEPGPLLNLAGHYGLDAKAILAQASAPDPTSTPSTAGASAKKNAGKAKNKAKNKAKAAPRGVAYRDEATGSTWSGKGLRPAWLRAKLAGGASLSDFEVKKAKVDAGSAGGGKADTEDLFNAEEAHA
jgi:ParB/RepB/Spo0J family partition protein